VQASSLVEGRGALQKTLATFLSRQPNGTVLLTNIDQVCGPLLVRMCQVL
jgi:hypothetical protein